MISEDMDYLITANKIKPVKDFYPKMSKKALIHLYELVMQKKVLDGEYSKRELSDIVYSLVLRGYNIQELPYHDGLLDNQSGLSIDEKGNVYYHDGLLDYFGNTLISFYDIPLSLNTRSKCINKCGIYPTLKKV